MIKSICHEGITASCIKLAEGFHTYFCVITYFWVITEPFFRKHHIEGQGELVSKDPGSAAYQASLLVTLAITPSLLKIAHGAIPHQHMEESWPFHSTSGSWLL